MLQNIKTERIKEIILPITSLKWEQYFKHLLAEEFRALKDDVQPISVRLIESSVRFTMEEVKKECNSLKTKKALCPGDIYRT